MTDETIEQAPDDADPEAATGEAPTLPGGQDVRVGPEDSDEPEAGAAEPTD